MMLRNLRRNALYLILAPFMASADERVDCELEFFPVNPQPAWIENFNLCNDDIRRFVEARALGFEYYAPALEQFSNLTASDQVLVMEATNVGTTTEGGLEPDLRVPVPLIEAVLAEAAESGADEFWDIPAFEEVLVELRDAGETASGDTFGDLAVQAPTHVDMIFFVNAVRRSQEALSASEQRLEDAQGDLERLEAAQARLEAARESLELSNEIIEKGRIILGE